MSFWPNLATLGELGTAETINPMITVRVKLVRAADRARRMKIMFRLYKNRKELEDMQFNLLL